MDSLSLIRDEREKRVARRRLAACEDLRSMKQVLDSSSQVLERSSGSGEDDGAALALLLRNVL